MLKVCNWRQWMMPGMQMDYRVYSAKYMFLSALIASFLALFSTLSFAQTRVVSSGLPDLNSHPSQYAGFARLLDDDSILVPEELLDINKNIKRIAFYHNGDRLHRKIPKQVHLMLENKLFGKFMGLGRFEVVDCIECRTTRVNFENSRMHISQSAQSNEDLRELSKKVRVDAFLLWSASVHENKFTVNLRMISAKSNEIIWLKEYVKKTTREQEELEFESIEMEFTVSALGLSSTRPGVGAVGAATLDSVSAFGLRRRESTSLNKEIEYSLGVEYFKNFSAQDEFSVSGINLEGRVYVNISAMQDWVPTKAYLGVGQSFFSGSHGLMLKFGLEFPFVTNGFMSLGAVHLVSKNVEWDANADYADKSEFGGSGLDLTLGYRF
jgi:hypothetical protein